MYPLGIGSECWLIWLASGVGPEWYGWALWGVLGAYVPGEFWGVGLRSLGEGLIWDRELYFIFAHDCAEEEDDEGKGAGEE